MKAKAAGSNRTRVLPKASDTGPIPLSRLVDSNGNTLQDSDLITALGKALDTANINGTDATTIFTENGALHPAFIRQVHEAMQYESRRNLCPDSNILYDLLFWSITGAMTYGGGVATQGGNAFSYLGTGAASGTNQAQGSPVTVVQGQTYTISGNIDARFVTAGTPRWTLYDAATMATLYVEADAVNGNEQRVSQQWVCPVGVTSVVMIADTNNCTVTLNKVLGFWHPMVETGVGMSKYITESVTFGPKSKGVSTVANGAGISNIQLIKFPAPGGAGTAYGDCIFKVSITRASVSTNRGFVIHMHVEPSGTVCSVHIMASGRPSTDDNSFRVRQETGTGHIFLDWNITPTSNTMLTTECEPINGTYPSGGCPVAVNNGLATAGTAVLGPRAVGTGVKTAIHDNTGAQNTVFNDGTQQLYSGTFTDTNGCIADETSIHGWNALGIGALCTASPLVSTAAGNINVSACTYRRGSSGIDVNFNAVTGAATGLGVGAQRFIYADINPVSGGTKSWLAATSASTACNGNYRICLGQSAPIPSSGSGSGGASGGSGCVDPDAWLDGMRQAKALWWGSTVLCSDGVLRRVRPTWGEVGGQAWRLIKWAATFWHGYSTGRMVSFSSLRLFKPEIIYVPRVQLTTDHVDLTCSRDTPFTLQDGTTCPNAGDMYRKLVLSPEYGWEEVTEVELLGLGPVVHIHLGGHSYAAGATPQKRGTSHNAYKP